jgi:hypothetical protein
MEILAVSFIPDTVPSPWLFLLLGSLATLLVSAGKGGFGGSIGLLSTPMMIYACGGAASTDAAKLAIGTMLPLLIACDFVAVFKWWGKWSWRPVALMLPGVVLGIAAGGVALDAFRRLEAARQEKTANAILMLSIGIIAVLFVAVQAWRMTRRQPPAFRPVLWQGSCFGAAAGFTSTLSHAAGPITAIYLLPQQMPRGQYVATSVLYYWIGNALKLGVYIPLRRLDGTSLAASLVFLPAVLAGTLLGVFLHHRTGKRSFDAIVYGLLLLAGAKLLIDSLPQVWK